MAPREKRNRSSPSCATLRLSSTDSSKLVVSGSRRSPWPSKRRTGTEPMQTRGAIQSALSRSLTLRALPSLLTDCVIIGHAKKADVVFTPPQWFALCAHMHNENPDNFFLIPFFDEKQGKPRFAKAYRADIHKRAKWAWDTITGRAKSAASIGFFPTNANRETRWAAMDFDAHDGDTERACVLAHKAFAVLIREPQLYVALTTSAGDPQHSGWHLFIFSGNFYPCSEWTRLLKQVAEQIGAPIQLGICEIFPDECRGIPRGIRAPGTQNPKNGEFGLILRETVSKLLPTRLPSGSSKERNCSLGTRGTTREELPSSPNRKLFRGQHGEWERAFAITAPSTRHCKLLKLVGTAFFQCGRVIAQQNAELQHSEATPPPHASLHEHLAEFDAAWTGMERMWKSQLTFIELERFNNLTTDTERNAFRILRNWSQTDSPDFKAHCQSLGSRLGITLRGASAIRRRFCSLGILRQTASYVPHKLAARYKWTASYPATEQVGPRNCCQLLNV
jgi:hypothetical protein